MNATAWHDGRLQVRLAGAAAAVSAACARLGGTLSGADEAEAWWLSVRDHSQEFFALTAADLTRGECLWRLSVPSIAAPVNLPGRQFIEWHGAQRWWRSTAAPSDVRAAAALAGGHATMMRGADKSAGVFTPLSGALMRIHHGLKQAFDPAGLFNPGRLYAEL
jgi:FAD/FMN-containing dehydrogenase